MTRCEKEFDLWKLERKRREECPSRRPVKWSSDFRRERIYTKVAGQNACERARRVAKRDSIFENLTERDTRNNLRADR